MRVAETIDGFSPEGLLEKLAARIEREDVPDVPCRICRQSIPASEDRAIDKPACWRCETISRQEASGFYREHQGATLADFAPELVDAANALLTRRNQVRGLFVVGPAGTGKTRLLAAIAAAYGCGTFGLARSMIRGTWNPETQDGEIRRLAGAPLLLLDDLGREGRPTESVLATLHEIISARNGNYLPTAATSNYTLEQLAERYDEAIADRLRPWKVVVMSGRSRR